MGLIKIFVGFPKCFHVKKEEAENKFFRYKELLPDFSTFFQLPKMIGI